MGDVLFVDDDPDLLDATRDVLQYSGLARCVVARSLDEVIDQRDQALGCTLAVLDVNLGTGRPTGVDVYRWLVREHFEGKVVFLTGHAGDNPMVESAADQSRVYMKPIDLADLARLVEESARANSHASTTHSAAPEP